MNLIFQEVWFSFSHPMYDCRCQKICFKIKEKTTYKIFSLFCLKSALIHWSHSLFYSTQCITSTVHKTINGTIKFSLSLPFTPILRIKCLFSVIPKQKQKQKQKKTIYLAVEKYNVFFSHHSLKTILNNPEWHYSSFQCIVTKTAYRFKNKSGHMCYEIQNCW